MTRSALARASAYELRPSDDGSFDELVVRDRRGNCIFHAEMMDDNNLWIGIYPPGLKITPVLRISARGKLKIMADEDD